MSALPAAPQAAAAAPDFGAPASGEKTPGAARVFETLEALQQHAQQGPNASRVTFKLSDSEVNEYLAWSLRERPRPDVRRLAVKFEANDEFSGMAVVDFASVQKWNQWIVPASLRSILKGDQPVQTRLKFQAKDGYGKVTVLQMDGPGNNPLERTFAAMLIHLVGLHQPELFDTTQPMRLPFGLQRLSAEKGFLMGDTDME